jgi:hypothetical protein
MVAGVVAIEAGAWALSRLLIPIGVVAAGVALGLWLNESRQNRR